MTNMKLFSFSLWLSPGRSQRSIKRLSSGKCFHPVKTWLLMSRLVSSKEHAYLTHIVTHEKCLEPIVTKLKLLSTANQKPICRWWSGVHYLRNTDIMTSLSLWEAVETQVEARANIITAVLSSPKLQTSVTVITLSKLAKKVMLPSHYKLSVSSSILKNLK